MYQQALAAGLAGDDLRQALTQYGSTPAEHRAPGRAVARLIMLAPDRSNTDDLAYYQRALRHYAAGLEPAA